MNKPRALIAIVGLAFILAIGAMAGHSANAATPTVTLASTADFSILAGTAVTNTGASTVNRSIGVHPGSSVTGFPPGIVGGRIHTADAVALQAKNDLINAYNDAAGRTGSALPGSTVGGRTLVGGVYTGGALDLTGTLTLDGQNDPATVWIFKAASSLTTASASSVVFINGGQPCNVFWQITSDANLGSGSTFAGTILALTSITLQSGVIVNGRALARNGNVTLINDTFVTSDCAPVIPHATFPPFTIAPSVAPTATPIATAAPPATPIATAASSATPTPARTSAPVAAVPTAAPAAIAGTQTLPSTSTDDPSGPLTALGVALTGIGIVLLRSRPVPHL